MSISAATKGRIALLAIGAVVALAAIAPGAARAEYYGGCTYSWGTPCYIVYGGINYLITQDPDHAVYSWGSTPPFNGYKTAKYDGVERDVCGTIMEHEGTLYPYGWTCGWGQFVQTYPGIVGYSAIGGAQYYNIALYQMIDWGEAGPCGQQGSNC
ncbi:MAG TPA: hypothetical protein VGN08_05675 [Solirubrobacteraceae bacterium]